MQPINLNYNDASPEIQTLIKEAMFIKKLGGDINDENEKGSTLFELARKAKLCDGRTRYVSMFQLTNYMGVIQGFRFRRSGKLTHVFLINKGQLSEIMGEF